MIVKRKRDDTRWIYLWNVDRHRRVNVRRSDLNHHSPQGSPRGWRSRPAHCSSRRTGVTGWIWIRSWSVENSENRFSLVAFDEGLSRVGQTSEQSGDGCMWWRRRHDRIYRTSQWETCWGWTVFELILEIGNEKMVNQRRTVQHRYSLLHEFKSNVLLVIRKHRWRRRNIAGALETRLHDSRRRTSRSLVSEVRLCAFHLNKEVSVWADEWCQCIVERLLATTRRWPILTTN